MLFVNANILSKLVPLPGKGAINTGLSAAKPSTLSKVLGLPREDVGVECRPVTNPKLRNRIITRSVGPFRVTELDLAVDSLCRVMDRLKAVDPEAYAQVGSAGMLCCRFVRGSKKTLSSHSWGTAIDLTFGEEVDPRGDGKCQLGLLRLYPHFHAEGWYWGAGFPREDSMHFEIAEETILRLKPENPN